MRTWSTPGWVKSQTAGSLKRGWAHVRNYGQGPDWLKVRWGNTFRIENQEGKDGMVRIKDQQSGREYIIDVNELNYWTRFA